MTLTTVITEPVPRNYFIYTLTMIRQATSQFHFCRNHCLADNASNQNFPEIATFAIYIQELRTIKK